MKCMPSVNRRVMKMSVVLLCLFGFIMHTVQFLLLYWTYPTVIDIQEYLPMEIDLPGISFCNSNGLRPQAFCTSIGYCYPSFLLRYLNFCGTFPAWCQYTEQPPSEMMAVTYHSFIENNDINASLMDMMKAPVKDFLTCKIVRGNEELECNMDDIISGSYYSDAQMFNLCYTINSLWGNPTKKIGKIRKYDKIVLDFFVDMSVRGRSESLDTIRAPKYNLPNFNAAIQLAVHSPHVTVSPFVSGMQFLAGKNYQIQLKLEDKHLLPPPYQTNCTDYMTPWRARGGTGPLNQMMAVEECKYNKSLELMGCVPFIVDYPHNETVCKYCPYCPEISDIEHECSKILHFYNQPCDFSTYEMKVLEKSVFVEKILENQKTGENESLIFAQKGYNCSFELVWIQRCQELSIEISFDDFLITNLTYNPKIESLELFSVIGGYMGVYIGVSLVAGYDLADIMLNALFALMKKKQEKNRKNKVSVENMTSQYGSHGDFRRRHKHSLDDSIY